MRQDDLEDELLWQWIRAQLEMAKQALAEAVPPLMAAIRKHLKTKESVLCLLLFSLSLFFLLRKSRLWSWLSDLLLLDASSSGSHVLGESGYQWQYCKADVGVFALQGRRAAMEDRFISTEIKVGESGVRINAVMDGHGGQYSADYVKNNFVSSLLTKIRLLKVLSNSKLSSRERLSRIHQMTSGAPISRQILKYLDLTEAEFKQVCPDGQLEALSESSRAIEDLRRRRESLKQRQDSSSSSSSNSSSSSDHIQPPTKHLILSSRVKPIEEVPFPTVPKKKRKESEMMEDLLSLKYSSSSNATGKARKSGSKSQACNRETRAAAVEKDISEYVNPKQNGSSKINYADLLRDEIADIDRKLCRDAKKAGHIGGTTLLVTLIDGNTLWAANVGDSRGIMFAKDGEVTPLSYDHKPSQLKEKKRIEEAGGYVAMNGVWRVQGILATSRALGDYPLKERRLITAEPDILSFNMSDMSMALLASDGLWDTHSNEAAAAFVQKHLRGDFKTEKRLLDAAKALALDSYRKESTDNVTIMLVGLA